MVGPDSVTCAHPPDGIVWNEYNQVVQCHRCGQVMDPVALSATDISDSATDAQPQDIGPDSDA